MSGQNFITILHVSLFLLSVWCCGDACHHVGISPLLGLIVSGVVMGPNFANIVPMPDAMKLAGQLGIIMTMIESGMHIRLSEARKVGCRAVAVALVGALGPLVSGFVMLKALTPATSLNSTIAGGMVMIPTSIGISMQLLSESKLRDKPAGQLIVVSAFIDDIIAIVTLSAASEWSRGALSLDTSVLQIIFSFLLVLFGALVSKQYTEMLVDYVVGSIARLKAIHSRCFRQGVDDPSDENRRVSKESLAHLETRDGVVLFLIITTSLGLSALANMFGSHLLGSFVAGLAFCQVINSQRVWKHQVKRIHSWLVRLFFAATVGFTIPISDMVSFELMWKGAVISGLAGVGAKMVGGAFAESKRIVVGIAMVGRGEFSFLMVQTFRSLTFETGERFLDETTYGICLWALLITCVVAPLSFRWAVDRSEHIDVLRSRKSSMKIRVVGSRHHGMMEDISDTLQGLEIDITDISTRYRDGDVEMEILATGEAQSKDIREQIVHALGDKDENVEIDRRIVMRSSSSDRGSVTSVEIMIESNDNTT